MSEIPSEKPIENNEITKDRASELLANAIAYEVRTGWRVVSTMDRQATLEKGGNVNHTFHLILTLVTCSFWGIVWLAMVLINQKKNLVITVDKFGNVLRQES